MASKKFSLYRYQLIPSQRQMNLLFDINGVIKKKNATFKNILSTIQNITTQRHNRKYNFEIARHTDDKFLLIISNQRNVHYFRKDHVKDSIQSFPPAFIIIDNAPDRQILAVENSKDYNSSQTLVNILQQGVQRFLKDEHLCIKIAPIYEETNFWKFIEKNKENINLLRFILITPNMSNISGGLAKDFKELAKITKAATSEYTLKPEKGAVLDIAQDNDALRGLAEYAANGGGTTYVKLRNSKMTYNSNDYQMTIEIGEAEFQEDLITQCKNIMDKIHGDYR